MSLMLKLSTLAVATTLLLNAEFNLENFVKNDLIKNPDIKVNSVKLLEKKDVPNQPDWKAYLFVMDLNIKGKEDKFPETVFVNEKANITTMSFYDLKQHKMINKNQFKPKMPDSYYQESHLIFGKKDAPHKLVVFSDPQCPFCIQTVPSLIQDVKDNPDKFALYYYHMPLLRIHPVSGTLTKVMEVLQKQGKVDDAMKMYNLRINPRETNVTKILDAVNKQLNIKVSKEEIEKPEIQEQIKKDMDMATGIMLSGTPTIYLDGNFSKNPTDYKKYLK